MRTCPLLGPSGTIFGLTLLSAGKRELVIAESSHASHSSHNPPWSTGLETQATCLGISFARDGGSNALPGAGKDSLVYRSLSGLTFPLINGQ